MNTTVETPQIATGRQKFMGMLVLDMSRDTRVNKVATLIQTMASAFGKSYAWDTITGEQADMEHLDDKNIVSGLCVMCSDNAPSELHIPTKNSSVFSWLNGTVTNPGDVHRLFGKPLPEQDDMPDILPGKLMLSLNSEKHKPPVGGEYENYTHRISDRLTSFMQGRWSTTSLYVTRHSTIVIAKRSQELYFSLVNLDQCSLLVWSTEIDLVPRLLEGIPADYPQHFLKAETFVNHITPLANKSSLVMHPMYLLTKYRKWGIKSRFNHVKVFTVLGGYLERIAR